MLVSRKKHDDYANVGLEMKRKQQRNSVHDNDKWGTVDNNVTSVKQKMLFWHPYPTIE